MLQVFCDGAVEPRNPGGWGVGGWLVKSGEQLLVEGSRDLGCYPEMTNNIAEYGAVQAALEFLVARGWTGEAVDVATDSELVVKQLNDEYRVRSEHLRPLRDAIWKLTESFPSVTFRWIPREQNVEADARSRRLYRPERMFGNHPPDEIFEHGKPQGDAA